MMAHFFSINWRMLKSYLQDLRKATHICRFGSPVNTIFGGFAHILRKS